MFQIAAISQEDAALQVSAYLKKQGWSPLSCRPWNRFDPHTNEWLVIPSPDWPAYPYGKFFFVQTEVSGRIRIGLTVERGLGKAFLFAFPGPKGQRLIMDERWTWHGLIRDLLSGSFQSAMDRITASLGEFPTIELTGGPVDDPEVVYDPSSLIKWDQVEFTFDDSGLVLQKSKIRDGCLREVSRAGTFPELGEALAGIPDPDWMWTNFNVYIDVLLADNPKSEHQHSMAALWKDYLVHFDRWFC